MVREVCLYETAELETVRVTVPVQGEMQGFRSVDCLLVQEQHAWLRENGTGVFSWRQGARAAFGRSRSAVFIFSDPDTALAFKMRWA